MQGIDKYVIMSNHIYLLISLNSANGRSGTPVPTFNNNANSEISRGLQTKNGDKMELPKRKPKRLANYDYSLNGAYFITICTLYHAQILSEIVGTGVLDRPKIELSQYGIISDEQIKIMNDFYDSISVDKYVIMLNHIHLLISLNSANGRSRMPVPTVGNWDLCCGRSGTPVPTFINNANSEISKFVGTFKRLTNKKYGNNIWQSSFYDHVIRSEQDYREIWDYIVGNPAKWREDRFYINR